MTDPAPTPQSPATSLGGASQPDGFPDVDEQRGSPEPGIALSLSGGGYRAMLFHVGVLWRLDELGLLKQLKRISSVSGGSITAAVLGMEWKNLGFSAQNPSANRAQFQDLFVAPIRKMAATSIDVSSVLWGSLNPWTWVSDEVSGKYDEVLFHGRTLQDLPDDHEGPRFVINATNVKTGSLWRFARPYMADYRVGIVDRPKVSLADAVTASSAFPPVLSPMRLRLDPDSFRADVPKHKVDPSLRKEAILTDGGVYDNLGLEPIWKRYDTILVSDAGRNMDDDLSPATDWAGHSRRLIDLLQHQVSNLRRRTAVGAFVDPNDLHSGAYWGIQTEISKYPADKKLYCPHEKTLAIAFVPTRLTALKSTEQERIINWGYAVSDAAVRSHLKGFEAAPPPTDFPYRLTGLG
jgi:NTE family protein